MRRRALFGACIVENHEVRRPAPARVGGFYFSRYGGRDSLIKALQYVGATQRERRMVLAHFDHGLL